MDCRAVGDHVFLQALQLHGLQQLFHMSHRALGKRQDAVDGHSAGCHGGPVHLFKQLQRKGPLIATHSTDGAVEGDGVTPQGVTLHHLQ
eukprot:Skav218652  [mRNA]  locus=scaffold365:741794:743308:+ [translate_table: standard]